MLREQDALVLLSLADSSRPLQSVRALASAGHLSRSPMRFGVGPTHGRSGSRAI